MDKYQADGYKDREDYLDGLAEEYGGSVYSLADLFGPSEDFDGLICALEDLNSMYESEEEEDRE